MPVQIEARQDGVGIIYNCSGAVTIDDYFQAGLGFLAAPEDIKKWRYCLVDVTAVDAMQISTLDIRAVVEQNKRIAALAVPGVLLAVASPNDIGFGLSRMWETLTEEIGWETMTFRSRPEAERWLKQRALAKFALDLSVEFPE